MLPNLRETRTPESRCPYCNIVLDCASAADLKHPNATPKPGDMSVCLSCASVLVFDDDLRSRAPKPGEVEAAFKANPEFAETIRRAQRAVRAIDRRNMRHG